MVTSSFPRWEGDWAGVFILKLAEALDRLGHSVTVLAPHAPGTLTQETVGRISICRFRYFVPARFEVLSYGQGMLYNIRKNPMRSLLIIPFLVAQGAWLLRLKRGIDIVSAHWLIPQGFIARLFRVPAVISLHGSDVNLRLGIAGRYGVRLILRKARAVTANSRATLERIGSESPGIPRRVIPMGIDIGTFKRVGGEKRDVSDHTKVLTVGRMIPWKGQRYLIEAIMLLKRKMPHVSLSVVGDGPDRAFLEKLAETLGVADSISFLGARPAAEIPRILWDHDIFVLSSIVLASGETEGLGTVLLEAMAAGLPVVGTNVGGIPDIIIDGKNGLLVPERSPEAIADAVLRLVGDATLSGRLARAALRTVAERFTWDTIAAQFESLFLEVIDDPRRKKGAIENKNRS